MKKKELSPEALAECAALKKIFMEKRKELGLTQEKAAQLLGMNQGSLSHYLNGRNALNLHFCLAIASLLGVPVSSFSKKYGDMLGSPGLEDRALEAFKSYRLSEAGEKAFQYAVENNVEEAPAPYRSPRRYPLISWIAAGERSESPDFMVSVDGAEYLETTENAGDYGYWLIVKGPSMTGPTSPSFPEGTRILVRPEGFDLVSGKYYVARHVDGEMTFKQYVCDAGTRYLAPLNPTFRTVEMDESWEIIGRVVDAKIPGL
ncbi:LexA family transcriptional regulator [Pseudomonas soli]|uniref:LexA family transcriptional regulator n=1 Tax=Pseudomonas soli TaxID=1306993 RepID=UPI0003C7A0E3|nr:repressor [Pseudomonas soli]